MPKRESHSTQNNGESQDASAITKLVTDQLAIENAYSLIDGYVLAVWHEPPPSPASQHDATGWVDPAA
jgi:hypothetical protein